jgi:hypothetical protein
MARAFNSAFEQDAVFYKGGGFCEGLNSVRIIAPVPELHTSVQQWRALLTVLELDSFPQCKNNCYSALATYLFPAMASAFNSA